MMRYNDTSRDAATQVAQQQNLQAALALADQGIPVFPFRMVPRAGKDPQKKPCITGFKDRATTDPAKIEIWFRRWTDAMPGIPTGSRTGFVVLDVDKKNGKDGFAELEQLGIDLDSLSPVQAESPGGSRHIYCKWSEGIGNSSSGLPPGLDVRGEGGYVAAPGAVNGKGAYRLLKGCLTEDVPQWPEALPIRRRTNDAGEAQPSGLPWDVFEKAVMAVPNSIPDREDWIPWIAAIHAESGGNLEGNDLAHKWSAQHQSYDPEHTDHVFYSFKADREGGSTGWRFIYEAQKHGFRHTELDRLLAQQMDECWTADELAEIERISFEERMEQVADQMGLDEEARQLVGVRSKPFFTDMAELLKTAAPPREWLVEDWIPAKTVHLMMGDGGTGKSLLAVQLAVATGTGKLWLGLDIEKPGPALYFGAEDDLAELHRRFESVCHALGVEPSEHGKRVGLRSAVAEDTILAVEERRTGRVKPTPVLNRLEDEIARVRPSLVVLDTLANLHALDSNSQEQAKAFVALLIGVAQRQDCTIVLLAHPSRTGMASGGGDGFSVAWSNAVRSRSYLAEDPDAPGINTLTIKKSNYGRKGRTLSMEWSAGAFESVSESYVDASRVKMVFLELLDRLWAQRRYVSAVAGPNYAPTQFAQEPEAKEAGFTKDQFNTAMREMLRADVLTVEDYTTDHRKKGKRLARGEGTLFSGEASHDDLL